MNWEMYIFGDDFIVVELLISALKCGRALHWESGKLGSGLRSAVNCCVILDKWLIYLLEGEGTMVA